MLRTESGILASMLVYCRNGPVSSDILSQGVVRDDGHQPKIARSGLPVIVSVTEFRDTIGVSLTNIVGGADSATALKKATATFQPVLDKSNDACMRE